MIFNMVGGGKEKASKVISVANASALPSSADVGTIAIISSIAVNDVYVNVTAPATPETGDVWITPDAAAENWSYIIGNACHLGGRPRLVHREMRRGNDDI